MNGYTEAQEQIQKTVRDFARREVAPGATERDLEARFDYALYRKLGDIGVTGMLYPEELGGSGADTLSYCLAIEELSRADMSLAMVMWVGAGGGLSLMRGSEQQRAAWMDRFVLPMVRGEAVSAGAITEPDAGSDTAGIKTRAVLDGDDWVLNGSKIFISNAGLENCAYAQVLARTEEGFGLFVVPTGTPGYHIGPPLRKMGLRSADTRELHFDDCRIPAYSVLGGRGSGRSAVVGGGFALTRVYMASQGVGMSVECLEVSLAHARNRVAFKRNIGQFQHVQAMLVEMAVEGEASRALRDKAARMADARVPYTKEAAMAKLYCTEAAKRAADNAVQIFGALGFMEDTTVNRFYRDIRASTIAEGTTQVQQHIIARELGAMVRTED